MAKKNYSTPELKSQKVQLGVFGDYSNQDGTMRPINDGSLVPWISGRGKDRME